MNNAKQSPLLKHGKEWKTNVNSELKSILSVLQVGIKELGWKQIISTREEKIHVNSQPQKMILHLHLPDPDYNRCFKQLLDSWLKGDYLLGLNLVSLMLPYMLNGGTKVQRVIILLASYLNNI